MLEWDGKNRDDFEELFEKAKEFGWYDDMWKMLLYTIMYFLEIVKRINSKLMKF